MTPDKARRDLGYTRRQHGCPPPYQRAFERTVLLRITRFVVRRIGRSRRWRDLAAFQSELTRLAAASSYGITSVEAVDTNLEAIFDYLV